MYDMMNYDMSVSEILTHFARKLRVFPTPPHSCLMPLVEECPAMAEFKLRSSKVIDLDVSRKRICDFLLVTNSNFGRISHRVMILTFKARKWLVSYPFLV